MSTPANQQPAPRHMRLGHSPDSDDAFMFYALAEHKIPSEGFDFEHVLRDIQTLNEWAREGALEPPWSGCAASASPCLAR